LSPELSYTAQLSARGLDPVAGALPDSKVARRAARGARSHGSEPAVDCPGRLDAGKSRNWLDCHQRMCAFYSGVPHVTVPDCLKQGVLKCHWYDPDLNPSYAALAAHYATEVVPARPSPRIYIRDSTLAIDGSRLDRGDDPGGTLAMQGRLVGSYRSIVRQAERSSAERDCRLFLDRG